MVKLRKVLVALALLAAQPALLAGSNEATSAITTRSRWPEIWGDLGVRGYGTGNRVAPNGLEFDPLFKFDFDLNIGLLPRRKFYLFLDGDFWAQRAAPGVTNKNLGNYDFSKRELDLEAGLAWNVVHNLELRASAYSLSNFNRGTSRTTPSGYQNGVDFEARYYFDGNVYDTGRQSFIGLGYYPSQELISGTGVEFNADLFVQAYATYSIPSLRSYLYGGAKLIGQEHVDLRLVTVDGGVAIRPFDRLRNLEVRVGNEFTADVKDDTTRNLVYGAIRGYFGGRSTAEADARTSQISDARRSPEIWGQVGLSVYASGDRMAPNGVEFDPLAMGEFNLNFGLLPRRKLYLFLENRFWIQRSTAAGRTTDDPANDDLSEREHDLNIGFAWNFWSRFELRGSAYAISNLNRGGAENKGPSQALPSGYQDGIFAEFRYYCPSDDIYDTARQSFVAIGYFPSQSMIGGNGVGFHPGLFARAYANFDLPKLRSYVYGDAKLIAERTGSARLVTFDAGLAARPFPTLENVEFRVGNELTADVQDDTRRNLPYGAIRINFSTR